MLDWAELALQMGTILQPVAHPADSILPSAI
jgi:hypothetical protein